MYSYTKRDLLKEWLDNPELKDYDECLQLGVLSDRMGNSGTYIRYDYNFTKWQIWY